MRNLLTTGGLLGAALLISGCTTLAGWNSADAANANRLEIQVNHRGFMTEIEYHIDPAQVPAAVKASMDAMHPGGPYIDAEKESHRGATYYELKRIVNGREVEAMFTSSGRLHSEEIEVDVRTVPAAVQNTALATVPGDTVTAWEEIRDGQRQLTEYHVKMAAGGKNYKLAISTAGVLTGKWMEIPAEIEAPVQ